MSRLTNKQRLDIIAAYTEGESKRSIARRYGVSDGTIRNICDKDPEVMQKCAQKRAEDIKSVLAHMETQKGRVCSVIDLILERIASPENLDAATLPQLATTLGILVDKYTAGEGMAASARENNLFSAIVGNAKEEISTDDIPELEQAAAASDDMVEPPTVQAP